MTVKRCILFVILLCRTSFPFRFKENQLQRWALLVADDLGFWRSPPTHPQVAAAEPLGSKQVIKSHGSLGALLLSNSVPVSPVDISHRPSPPLLVAQEAVRAELCCRQGHSCLRPAAAYRLLLRTPSGCLSLPCTFQNRNFFRLENREPNTLRCLTQSLKLNFVHLYQNSQT